MYVLISKISAKDSAALDTMLNSQECQDFLLQLQSEERAKVLDAQKQGTTPSGILSYEMVRSDEEAYGATTQVAAPSLLVIVRYTDKKAREAHKQSDSYQTFLHQWLPENQASLGIQQEATFYTEDDASQTLHDIARTRIASGGGEQKIDDQRDVYTCIETYSLGTEASLGYLMRQKLGPVMLHTLTHESKCLSYDILRPAHDATSIGADWRPNCVILSRYVNASAYHDVHLRSSQERNALKWISDNQAKLHIETNTTLYTEDAMSVAVKAQCGVEALGTHGAVVGRVRAPAHIDDGVSPSFPYPAGPFTEFAIGGNPYSPSCRVVEYFSPTGQKIEEDFPASPTVK